MRPKPDASKWYKTQQDTTDKVKIAQQSIRDKLQQEMEKAKLSAPSARR